MNRSILAATAAMLSLGAVAEQLNFPAAEVADEQGRFDLASPAAWGGEIPGASTDVRVAGGGSRTVTASQDVEFGLLINGLDTWKSNRLTFDMTGYEPPRKLKFTGFRSGETSSSFLHTTFRGGIWDFGGGSFGSYYGNYYGDYHDLVVSDAAVITNVASICLGYMAQKGLSAELLGNSRVFVDGVFQFGNNKDGASDPNILKVCDGSLLDLGQLAWDGQSVAEWHPEYTHDAYRATVLVSNATLVSRASTTCIGRRGQDLLHVTRNGLFKALKNVTAFDNLSRCSKIRVEDGGEIAIGTSFYGGGGASDHEGLNDNRIEILENGKLSVGWYFHLGYGCNYGNTLVVSNGTYIGAFYWGGRNGTIRLQGPNVKFDSGENTGLFDDQPNCTFEISDGCTYVPKVTLWSCGGGMTSNCTLRISRNGTLAKSLTVERKTSLSLTTPSTVVDNRIIVEEGGSISGDFLDVIGVRTRLRLSDSTITLRSTAISLAVGWNTTAYGGLSSDCTFTLAGTHPAVKTSGMMAVMGGSKVVFELPEDGYDAGCIPLDLAGGIRAWGEGGKLMFTNAEAMREKHLKDENGTQYVLVRIPVGKDFIPDDVIAEAQASLGDGFRLYKTVSDGYQMLKLRVRLNKGLTVILN